MRFLPLILRNLLRNRRRTILTMMSIAVSVLVFSALMSLPEVVNEVLRDSASSLRIVTYSTNGFTYPLPEAYRRKIERIPHVDAVAGDMVFIGTYRAPQETLPVMGVDPEPLEEIFPDWNIKTAEADELRQTRSGALVGPTLMRMYRWRVGDTVIVHGTTEPVDVQLKIVGTLGGRVPPTAAIMRRDSLDEALGRPGTVNIFWVKVDSSNSVPTVTAAIDETFANSPAQTKSESEAGFVRNQVQRYRVLFDGVKVLAVIVVFTIALVAANTAAMSVRERRQELAVMRSIGFTRRIVNCCIAIEGLLIGLAGGLVGCALAWTLLRLLPRFASVLGPLVMRIGFMGRVALESILIAATIGLASALIPALSATRHEVAEEIRALV